MAQQTTRERIADALYLIAAGADEGNFLETTRAYVVAHSKTKAEVTALLRELFVANPEVMKHAIRALVEKPPKAKTRIK